MHPLAGDWTVKKPARLLRGIRALIDFSGIDHHGAITHELVQNELIPLWGPEMIFYHNIPIVRRVLELEERPGLIEEIRTIIRQMGVLDEISMRTLRGPGWPTGGVTVLLTGGTAIQMEQAIIELKDQIEKGLVVNNLYTIAGTRYCDSEPELSHPSVERYRQANGRRLPREGNLQSLMLAEMLPKQLYIPLAGEHPEVSVRVLFEDFPALAQSNIYIPTATNVLHRALRDRRAIRGAHLWFDASDDRFWYSQPAMPLAENARQEKRLNEFVHPFEVLSGLAWLLDELCRL